MKVEIFSHHNGDKSADKKIKEDVIKILQYTNFKIREGCANELRKTILSQLKKVDGLTILCLQHIHKFR